MYNKVSSDGRPWTIHPPTHQCGQRQEYQIMLGAGMATKMKKLNSCVVFEYFSTIIFKEDIEGLMVWGMN